MKVPFNKIPISGNEIQNIQKAIESGHLQGDGMFLKSAEAKLKKILSVDIALLTNSCTSSLELAAFLCDIKPGDEVIVPTYTFVSTISAFVLRGAIPVFCDVKETTLNLDETKLEELITPKTKAIVPVHYAGVSCEMDEILEIAKRHNVKVVEDAAQGFMSKYKSRPLGTLGDFGSLSFHSTKNVICGEGGALLMKSPDFFDRANFIREKGTNRIHFIEGKVDKYTWVDYGSSYIPSELCTAFLDAQLDCAEKFTRARQSAWSSYYERLSGLEKEGKIKLPKVPKYCTHNAHIFFILTRSEDERKSLGKYLQENGISSNAHYAPLHTCPMAETLGCDRKHLPVAESAAGRMLRLPIYSTITSEELEYVCDNVAKFYK